MVRDFTPEEISYLATTFAVSLAKSLDSASIKVMCTFFVDVVGTLNLISAQRGFLGGCYHNRRQEKPPEPPPSGQRPVR